MQINETDLKSVASWCVVGLLTIMFSSNIFFVKRIVDKLDTTEQSVYALRVEIATLRTQLDDIQNRRNHHD